MMTLFAFAPLIISAIFIGLGGILIMRDTLKPPKSSKPPKPYRHKIKQIRPL